MLSPIIKMWTKQCYIVGISLGVIVNIEVNWAIIISAIVALVYTMFGQMVAVAYTDVLQFSFVVIGMVCSLTEDIIFFYYYENPFGNYFPSADKF